MRMITGYHGNLMVTGYRGNIMVTGLTELRGVGWMGQ